MTHREPEASFGGYYGHQAQTLPCGPHKAQTSIKPGQLTHWLGPLQLGLHIPLLPDHGCQGAALQRKTSQQERDLRSFAYHPMRASIGVIRMEPAANGI